MSTQSTDRVHAGDRVASAENINRRGTFLGTITTHTFGLEVQVQWDSGLIECLPPMEVWPLPK